MTQTWAIFVDAYRSLNAKKMFWIVLAVSGLVVAGFAAVGINERGLKILVWQFDLEVINSRVITPAFFYKQMFVGIGIGFWLSWLATILALVSTAGIFPDLISSGSIDLFVSKPISRLRLFLTEYLAGLLFAAIQVTMFTAACFLLLGVRGGVWEPGLFIAIPIVVCFFSYLFSVCVLLGVLTRSTLASLLLVLLFWFFLWGLGASEELLLALSKPETRDAMQDPSGNDHAPPAERDDEGVASLRTAHRIVYGVKTALPKTTETIALLERSLTNMAELPEKSSSPEQRRVRDAQRELLEAVRSRSVAWVVGTSLLFEAAVIVWAALVFCRRDY